MGKTIFKSKTFYVNLIALIAMLVQGISGKEIISLEMQAGALSVVNLILRMFTKEPIAW